MTKLQPDRDLQCYFYEPSAVAALSATSASGFTVSGCWRQQFDWVVIEWNRDNVFEHPALRNLPDGDLSGVVLSYTETRTNCIPLDSTLYPTVDWPSLRVWAVDAKGVETIHYVPLANYATAVDASSYAQPTVIFEFQGTPAAGDIVGLAWLDQHPNYWVVAGNTAADVASGLAANINAESSASNVSASALGAAITLTYNGAPGANGNRVGVYGWVYTTGGGSGAWSPSWGMFQGGTSPSGWQVSLDFGRLVDRDGVTVPTTNVRKLRWTWAADLQAGEFARSEFSVVVSDWNVTGSNLDYSVAGYGSLRVEDVDPAVSYKGAWQAGGGNYSGGSIHRTTAPGAAVTASYMLLQDHSLYLGTRRTDGAAKVSIVVDGAAAVTVDLEDAAEDLLVRLPLGAMKGGVEHTVKVTHAGTSGESFYFDFLEAALPSPTLPAFAAQKDTTLATDWDTLHSQAIAPERTAWLIDALGFKGRANHYAGCLWFYELVNPGKAYASATVTFSGAPTFGKTTTLMLGATEYDHVNLIGDTAETMATSFALLINSGSTGVWAMALGAALTIVARAMGHSGNGLTVAVDTHDTSFTGDGDAALAGGVDGAWLVDLAATPRLNRAARDWTASFLAALKGYGIESTVSFSMELGNGDSSLDAAIAQRYPDGTPCLLSTPSLQTNFGAESTAFWAQVYADMAAVMDGAGVPVYLQFGEVQWWYFAGAGRGMAFYDAETVVAFLTKYGTAMHVFLTPADDPTNFPDESAFLPGLIGTFCAAVRAAVRAVYPDAVFEVLYPPQTNTGKLTAVINFPTADWTPANLACLKTEDFNQRDLDQARGWMAIPGGKGFPARRATHLVGCGDYTSPWIKEWRQAQAMGLPVVLWALDQFCLCGWNPQGEPGAQAWLA